MTPDTRRDAVSQTVHLPGRPYVDYESRRRTTQQHLGETGTPGFAVVVSNLRDTGVVATIVQTKEVMTVVDPVGCRKREET